LKAKVLQCHINKEMCIVSVAFPLFCWTPVCVYKAAISHSPDCVEEQWVIQVVKPCPSMQSTLGQESASDGNNVWTDKGRGKQWGRKEGRR
jgi:hypothetical protein